MSEQDYITGKRMALCKIIRACLKELGHDPVTEDTPLIVQCQHLIEREDTLIVLRRMCGVHGDNDWPHNLHLADILEKHLERYLDANQETDAG